MEINKEELMALKFYLKIMAGFDESGQYEDYQRIEKFSDEDYVWAINILSKLVNRLEGVQT